jgi:hypothetical protein
MFYNTSSTKGLNGLPQKGMWSELCTCKLLVSTDFAKTQFQDGNFEINFWAIKSELDIAINMKLVHWNVKNRDVPEFYLECPSIDQNSIKNRASQRRF